LIGLGGAEFRLPVLIGIFRFQTLQAIVLNLVVSLVTVFFSFFFRIAVVDFAQVVGHTPVILNILVGSLIGSYAGVHFASKKSERSLTKIVVVLLVLLSMVLIAHDFIFRGDLKMTILLRTQFGFISGIVVGTVSSMLGVAGGELIIPTIVLLYGV